MFRSLGAGVLAISFEPVERLPMHRETLELPFPIVSDPTRAAYEAFGLGSADWRRLFGLGVIRRYAGLMLRGYRPRRTESDVQQLGGDFVIDARRRLVYAHRSADPADRPPVSEWLSALERACRGGSGASASS